MTKIDKLIKTKPQNTKNSGQKGTDYEELKRRMKGICNSLSWYFYGDGLSCFWKYIGS